MQTPMAMASFFVPVRDSSLRQVNPHGLVSNPGDSRGHLSQYPSDVYLACQGGCSNPSLEKGKHPSKFGHKRHLPVSTRQSSIGWREISPRVTAFGACLLPGSAEKDEPMHNIADYGPDAADDEFPQDKPEE